jgi:hypothetical protein
MDSNSIRIVMTTPQRKRLEDEFDNRVINGIGCLAIVLIVAVIVAIFAFIIIQLPLK